MNRRASDRRARTRVLAAVMCMVHVTVLVAPSSASAQTCDTNCPIRMRDARGCCPASAAPTPTPSSPAKPDKAPASKPAKPGKACPAGQEVTPDTAGHCCWPGQAWAGSKCVGVPSMCPSGFNVAKESQSCELVACEGGMVRANDAVHCCWPGQAWSTRETCVGIPQCPENTEPEGEKCISSDLDGDGIPNKADKCPQQAEDKDGFQDDDGCPDPDNDGDGIADANDRCPLQPEDKNQYQDDDGCPDEPERAGIVAAQERVKAAKAEEERKQAAEEARKKQEAEERAREQEEEEGRSARRGTGWGLTIGGVAAGALAGTFMALGAGTNSSIKDGGIASGSEIESKNKTGKLFNGLAIGSGIVGGVLVAIGLPLILANGSKKKDAPKTGLVWDGTKVRF